MKNVDAYMQFENFDKKDSVSRFFENKKIGNDDYRRIFRRDEFLSKLKRESDRYKSETLFSKHKYFELSFFYEDTIE